MTKEQKRNWIYNKYKQAQCHLVTQYYKTSCSPLKISADNWIRHEMEQLGGTRYHIVSGNCFQFTCAFCLKDRDTGKWVLKYVTKYSVTDYELTEEEANELHLC